MILLADLAFFSLLVLQVFTEVRGSGKLSLRLVTFVNPGGVGANGHCCDGRWKFCQTSGCDHYFHICADLYSGPAGDIDTCHYGSVITPHINDRDEITFGDKIGSISNPITIPLREWEGGLRVKVKVWDHDDGTGGGADYVDFISARRIFDAAPSLQTAPAHVFNLEQRTRMAMDVRVYCDVNFYGSRCNVFCVDRNDDGGHYDCHQGTGQKVCHAGWSGNNCQSNIQECLSSPCQNNGQCIDRINGFSCNCNALFTGARCEHPVSPCSSRPCRNGGTCVTPGEGVPFSCKCPTGFFGNLCHLRATTPTTLITPATTDETNITSESGTSDVNGTDVWHSTTESIVMTTETDNAGLTSPHCIFTGDKCKLAMYIYALNESVLNSSELSGVLKQHGSYSINTSLHGTWHFLPETAISLYRAGNYSNAADYQQLWLVRETINTIYSNPNKTDSDITETNEVITNLTLYLLQFKVLPSVSITKWPIFQHAMRSALQAEPAIMNRKGGEPTTNDTAAYSIDGDESLIFLEFCPRTRTYSLVHDTLKTSCLLTWAVIADERVSLRTTSEFTGKLMDRLFEISKDSGSNVTVLNRLERQLMEEALVGEQCVQMHELLSILATFSNDSSRLSCSNTINITSSQLLSLPVLEHYNYEYGSNDEAHYYALPDYDHDTLVRNRRKADNDVIVVTDIDLRLLATGIMPVDSYLRLNESMEDLGFVITLIEDYLLQPHSFHCNCLNGGICKRLLFSFECLCATGYVGNRCQYDDTSSLDVLPGDVEKEIEEISSIFLFQEVLTSNDSMQVAAFISQHVASSLAVDKQHLRLEYHTYSCSLNSSVVTVFVFEAFIADNGTSFLVKPSQINEVIERLPDSLLHAQLPPRLVDPSPDDWNTVQLCVNQDTWTASSVSRSHSYIIIIICVIAFLFLLLVVTVGVYCYYRRRRSNKGAYATRSILYSTSSDPPPTPANGAIQFQLQQHVTEEQMQPFDYQPPVVVSNPLYEPLGEVHHESESLHDDPLITTDNPIYAFDNSLYEPTS